MPDDRDILDLAGDDDDILALAEEAPAPRGLISSVRAMDTESPQVKAARARFNPPGGAYPTAQSMGLPENVRFNYQPKGSAPMAGEPSFQEQDRRDVEAAYGLLMEQRERGVAISPGILPEGRDGQTGRPRRLLTPAGARAIIALQGKVDDEDYPVAVAKAFELFGEPAHALTGQRMSDLSGSPVVRRQADRARAELESTTVGQIGLGLAGLPGAIAGMEIIPPAAGAPLRFAGQAAVAQTLGGARPSDVVEGAAKAGAVGALGTMGGRGVDALIEQAAKRRLAGLIPGQQGLPVDRLAAGATPGMNLARRAGHGAAWAGADVAVHGEAGPGTIIAGGLGALGAAAPRVRAVHDAVLRTGGTPEQARQAAEVVAREVESPRAAPTETAPPRQESVAEVVGDGSRGLGGERKPADSSVRGEVEQPPARAEVPAPPEVAPVQRPQAESGLPQGGERGQGATEVEARPVVNLREMRPQDLDRAIADRRRRDQNADVEALGPELAKEWRGLQRAANNPIDMARADRAQARIDEIERGLNDRQRRLLFGIGETGPNLETLIEVRERMGRLDATSPTTLGESMVHSMRDYRPGNQMAEAVITEGLRLAEEAGYSRSEIQRAAVTKIRRSVRDPADAAFLVERIAESMGATPKARPRPERPRLPGGKAAEGEVVEYGSLGPLAAPVKTVAGAVGQVGKGVVHELSTVPGRLRQLGTPESTEAAEKAEKALDRAGAARGEIASELDAAVRVGGSSWSGLTRLMQPEQVAGQDYGYFPGIEAIEGRQQPRTGRERLWVRAMNALIGARGRMFERRGLQQYDPVTKTWSPFVSGTGIAPREPTGYFFSIVTKGPGHKLWTKLVDAYEHATGRPRAEIETHLKEMGEAMKSGSEDSPDRIAQAEQRRLWPRIPHALREGGEWVPLVEADVVRYPQRLAERGAARAGVIEAFGQTTTPGTGPEPLVEAFAKKHGREEIEMAMRALHHAPVEPPVLDAGSPLGKVIRGYRVGMGAIKDLILSASAIKNVPEPFGATAEVLGTRRMLRGLVDALPGRGAAKALEAMGSKTVAIMDRHLDPLRPGESMRRVEQEFSKRGFLWGPVNEFQETLAGTTAQRFVRDLQAGKGGERERFALQRMGYTPQQADAFVSGRATPAEYEGIVRKAPSVLVGAHQSTAQRSRLENRKAFQAIQGFETFFQTQARDAGRMFKAWHESMRSALKDPTLSKADKWKRGVNANAQILRWIGGRSAIGIGGYLLSSFVLHGKQGLQVAWEETKDNIGEAALKGFVGQVVGGFFGGLGRAAFGDAKLSDAIFPWRMFNEVKDLATSSGAYEGMPFNAKVDRALNRFAPGTKAIDQGLAAMGFGSPEANDMDTAVDAYWRWRYDNYAPDKVTKGDQQEQQRQFRNAMRRAYFTMRRGGTPDEVQAEIKKGLEFAKKGDSSVAASMRNRLLLEIKGLDAQQEKAALAALRKRIGDKAYGYLETHDRLIRRMAQGLGVDLEAEVRKGPQPQEPVRLPWR